MPGAIFVGIACPGAGRDCRLPQRICRGCSPNSPLSAFRGTRPTSIALLGRNFYPNVIPHPDESG